MLVHIADLPSCVERVEEVSGPDENEVEIVALKLFLRLGTKDNHPEFREMLKSYARSLSSSYSSPVRLPGMPCHIHYVSP